uniref:Uncharacterized protein n=1 Tax=Anas zonorhyncha TaxID=75864 RepID=A0A8B9VXW9_9AVES
VYNPSSVSCLMQHPMLQAGVQELRSVTFRIIHILKHGAVKVTLIFYVYLQKLEKSDLDNWENIRGPQLWEDSRAVQQQRREAARLKTE